MAITKIPALGAAIRAKVGETEEKSVPQLTDIVEDQLSKKPTQHIEITSNGTYDMTEVVEAKVKIPGGTECEKNMLDSMKEIVKLTEENITTFETTGSRVWPWKMNLGKPVTLPYFDTSKAQKTTQTSQGATFGTLIKEIGLDFSGVSNVEYSFVHQPHEYITKYMLTGLTRSDDTQLCSRNLFQQYEVLEELYTDGISSRNTYYHSFQSMFASCPLLRIIGGFNRLTKQIDDSLGAIDFTSCANTTDMFLNAQALEEVRFVPNTLIRNLSLAASPKLSRATALSLINCLSGTNHTISLNQEVKDKMVADWKCKKNAETGLYEDSVDGDAISYTEAITSATEGKGWILA